MKQNLVCLIADETETFFADVTIDTTSKEVLYIEHPGKASRLEKDSPFDIKITTKAVQSMKVIDGHIRIYPDENTVVSDSFFEKARESVLKQNERCKYEKSR